MLVGLIPAAGHATRLGSQPSSKEVLVVGGRPMMDHLVDRMREAAPDEIRIVTRPEKTDVIRHAEDLGLRVIHGHPPEASASLLLGLEGLADDDEVMFGFPDSLWEPDDGFVRVVAELRADAAAALGLFRISEDLERSDVVTLDAGGRVTGVAVKPVKPQTDLIWGIAAARAGVLRRLDDGRAPGAFFDALAREDVVRGVTLSSRWIDVGTPEALERARRA